MKTTPQKTPPAAKTQDELASTITNNLTGLKEHRRAVTTKEACQMLGGISARSLRRIEQRGLIRSTKALRIKLFPIAEIERFLEETL